ncbi:hypothetical protein AtNW77_Chr3g0190721 [Arabidopsis thaliana]
MLPPTTLDGELIRRWGEKKSIWIEEEEGKLSINAPVSRNFCLNRISMSVLGLGPK